MSKSVWTTNVFDSVDLYKSSTSSPRSELGLTPTYTWTTYKTTSIVPGVTLASETNKGKSNMRLVKIYIVDNEASLPISSRLVFSSDEILTESSDNTSLLLAFANEINKAIDEHNKFRVTLDDERKESKKLKPVTLDKLTVKYHTVTTF